MRWNVSLLWPQNHLLANSCIYLIDSISDYISVFALEVGLIHSHPSQVSGWLSVLISCCCLIWPDLVVIFQFVLTLVNARPEWNQAKISCLVTFNNWATCAVFWSMDTSLLILNLVTTFTCYPSLYGACSYNPLVPLEISLSLCV
jgi:hypothetical protein